MDEQRTILRTCGAVILGALILRLVAPVFSAGGFWSLPILLQTGRVVKLPTEEITIEATEPPATEPEPVLPVFSEEDRALVQLSNASGYSVNLTQLLTDPLPWQESPTVLILHTHGTESYTRTEDYKESSLYRTSDTGYNVVSIGDQLAALLENAGIRVIHDRTMYDLTDYNSAYLNARSGIQAALAADPSVFLVLDLHRDAATDSSGTAVGKTVTTEKGQAAQLMFVMGTDAGGYTHPQWAQNLSLAVKLQAQLERTCPGICRPISLRTSRYNQDLSAGALLVEVGFTGNTRQEALLATEILADAIIALSGKG